MEESYVFRNNLLNSNWFNLLCHNIMPTSDISQKPLLEKLPEALWEVSNEDNATDPFEGAWVQIPLKLALFQIE